MSTKGHQGRFYFKICISPKGRQRTTFLKSYNFQHLPIWVLLYPACKKVLFRFLSCFRKALISQQKKRALKPLLIVVLFIRLAFTKNGRKVADGKRTQDHRSSAHEKSWTDRVKNLLRGLKDLLNICYKIP